MINDHGKRNQEGSGAELRVQEATITPTFDQILESSGISQIFSVPLPEEESDSRQFSEVLR
jgi:hypothetical protein